MGQRQGVLCTPVENEKPTCHSKRSTLRRIRKRQQPPRRGQQCQRTVHNINCLLPHGRNWWTTKQHHDQRRNILHGRILQQLGRFTGRIKRNSNEPPTTNTTLIEKMDASNKEWMQKMTDQQEKFMEMMLNNKPGGGDKRPRGGIKVRTGTTCKNCNKKGIHKDEDCFELESNAGQRPRNWKSVFPA